MPDVSVICAVKNGARYIAETIHSVLGQTFTNFEFIIVNDGSTDATAEIINSFSDARIIPINQQNSGVGAARNRALALAKSTYVAFVDADDVWLPHKLQVQIDFLKSHQQYDMVGAWCRIMDAEGNYLYTERKPETHAANWHALQTKNVFTPSSMMVKTNAIRAIGGFCEERFSCFFEDYILNYQLAKNGECHQLQQSLIYYRIVPASGSRMCVHYYGLKQVFSTVQRGYPLAEELEVLLKPIAKPSEKTKMANYYLFLGRSCLFHNFNRSKALQFCTKSIKLAPANKQIWIYFLMALMWPKMAVSWFYKNYGPNSGYTFVEKNG